MFAPNRLITTKEQWLLVGVAVAIITGCATLYLHDASTPPEEESSTGMPTSIRHQRPDASTRAQPVIRKATAPASTTRQDAQAAPERIQADDASDTIGVAVMGAVRRPGFYELTRDMRVADLISRAGGAREQADLSDIVLTAPLVDETTLTVPWLPEVRRNATEVALRRHAVSALINPPWYRHSASGTPEGGGTPDAPEQATPTMSGTSGEGVVNINRASSEQLQQLPGIGPVLASRIIEERNRRPFGTVEELTRVSGIAEKRLANLRPFITAP